MLRWRPGSRTSARIMRTTAGDEDFILDSEQAQGEQLSPKSPASLDGCDRLGLVTARAG